MTKVDLYNTIRDFLEEAEDTAYIDTGDAVYLLESTLRILEEDPDIEEAARNR